MVTFVWFEHLQPDFFQILEELDRVCMTPAKWMKIIQLNFIQYVENGAVRTVLFPWIVSVCVSRDLEVLFEAKCKIIMGSNYQFKQNSRI